MNEELTPGWYESADHGRRYWDGSSWLTIAPSASEKTKLSLQNFDKKKAIAVVGLVSLLVVGLIWNNAQTKHKRQVHQQELIANQQRELRRKNAAEISARSALVSEVESSVKKMAEGDIQDFTISANQIYSVSCVSVSGSYSVLTELSNTFQCFAATEHNNDGTDSGFYYNATINWDTGSYTYGLGKP